MKEKTEGLLKEFKTFIERGNVLDLAVGVVIGNAFGKIVTSVVNDLIMPLTGIFLGGLNFSNLTIKIGKAVIPYGQFINNVIDFFIISICVFAFVKVINTLTKKEKPKVEEPPKEPPKREEVVLLEEILEELKKKSKKKEK